ncbi:threonine/serine dehydratase [Paralimibaculum aggregatum]|uniref:Threonine/serine dehydratase n=1 Tax=Paralimibaculum aggregatum TaxID=3036245 RepID=A0ABQ6LP65_9RHOB|nr:threonine/serine dehydratase [Limibaculum sp. NKW23]GMG84266.1 threonine/serine dehydratase [Limibaculum sp. NKW23]
MRLMDSSEAITIKDVRSARRRLEGSARVTPLLEDPHLNAIAGRRVLVKAECLQRTGAFKFRGAWSALTALGEGARERGVITYSSGNHAQGIAHAAEELGIPATIVMPDDAPALKLANTRGYGAEVVLYDRAGGQSREEIGNRLAEARGLTPVLPYDEPLVIAGQGTAGLEIAGQARAMGVTKAEVLVCCGGGGLSAGMAVALAAEAPGLRVRTVEPAGFDDTARSLAAGERLGNEPGASSICDAILTPMPGELTFPILSRLAGPGLAVTDDEVLRTMGLAFQRLKLVTEPGGAVALAAALFHGAELADGPVVALISGGNVDTAMFRRALDMLDAAEPGAA